MKKKAKKEYLKANSSNKSKSAKITRLPIKNRVSKEKQKEGILSKIDRFFKESKAELTKVKWPTRKELIASTIAVIIICLVFALFLGIADFIIIKLLKLILR